MACKLTAPHIGQMLLPSELHGANDAQQVVMMVLGWAEAPRACLAASLHTLYESVTHLSRPERAGPWRRHARCGGRGGRPLV